MGGFVPRTQATQMGAAPAVGLASRLAGALSAARPAAATGPAVGVRTLNPALSQALAMMARAQARNMRFIELVAAAMRRTGRVQVELNPCDIWTAEELTAAARMARQPLSLQLGGRSFFANLREIRVRCPSMAIEWDYELVWGPFRDGSMPRGSVTILGEQVLMASLDPPLQRPVFASICYRNFQILRLDVPAVITTRFGPGYFGQVRDNLLREAMALPLCLTMLGLPAIGIS